MTMTTTAMTPEMSTLKTRLKTTWESGDYGVFSKYLEKGALEFFGRLHIPAGTRLLDVACGAGQLMLPAARKGIQVTGVASEMIRVCRLGGRISMGNWTPEGHIGQMFKVIGKHVPPPPYFPSPLLWGDEATCRQRLGTGVNGLKITRYMYPFEYPFAPAKVVDFFIEYYGPTNRAYSSLTDDGRKALHDDLTALWSKNNVATDGTTLVQAEYIEVIGTRA
jgi:hypothetical protein